MKITSIGSDSLILSLIFQMTTYLQTPVFFLFKLYFPSKILRIIYLQ